MFPVTDLPILTTGDNNSAVGGFDEMMLESLAQGLATIKGKFL